MRLAREQSTRNIINALGADSREFEQSDKTSGFLTMRAARERSHFRTPQIGNVSKKNDK